MVKATADQKKFVWHTQEAAAELVRDCVDDFLQRCPDAARLRDRLLQETGTRFTDWIDHMIDPMPGSGPVTGRLKDAGFICDGKTSWWHHPGGLFPPVFLEGSEPMVLALKVSSVVDFLLAHGLNDGRAVTGEPLAGMRSARAYTGQNAELWVVERHGSVPGSTVPRAKAMDILPTEDQFRLRPRRFTDPREGFVKAQERIEKAVKLVGVDRACDLFFAAEREYWMSRNHAARVQFARQQRLGMGWANHDHHTYRSSRECFADLVATLEMLGMVCRERFYAGLEAGWGAQVLEQPNTGVVIFADVDLSPDEVAGDFAHERLSKRGELGTVGLWCRLHGESFLQAGMHHLECQFDFDAARRQLAGQGVASMKPFTNFAHLKQSFTEGEVWHVDPQRLDAVLKEGFITPEQAQRFRAEGAIGSHMEVLERNAGYKGFNQTGINEIIRDTDPRRRLGEEVGVA